MKTLLMWGLQSTLSSAAAQKLAADGHRLLLVGESRELLEDVDARLSQSELHRLTVAQQAADLATWVQEQNLGLDGLVLFPPVPESAGSFFVPASFNLRNAERSLFGVVELVRAFLPQLRRGKRPKQVLVVLDWRTNKVPNPISGWLEQAWRAALPALTRELNKEGSHINLVSLLETTEPPAGDESPEHDVLPEVLVTENPSPSIRPDVDESFSGSDAPPLSAYVHSTLALIGLYFSPTMQFLNGQFVEHPSPSALIDPVGTVRR